MTAPVFVDRNSWLQAANRVMRQQLETMAGDDEWIRKENFSPDTSTAGTLATAILQNNFAAGARYVHVTDVLEAAQPHVKGALSAVNESAGRRGHTYVARDEVRDMVADDSAMGDLAGPAYAMARTVILANKDLDRLQYGSEVAEQLAEEACTFSVDGQYGSEGGDDLRAFHAPAKIRTFSIDALRDAMGIGPKDEGDDYLDFRSFDDFIAQTERTYPEAAAAIARTGQAFTKNLKNVTVFIRGEDGNSTFGSEHPIYIVGIARDGSVAGLESTVVWT